MSINTLTLVYLAYLLSLPVGQIILGCYVYILLKVMRLYVFVFSALEKRQICPYPDTFLRLQPRPGFQAIDL